VDSALRVYVKATGDIGLAHQRISKWNETILDLCLVHRFAVSHSSQSRWPFMIDRRIVGGHPLEIQVLFYAALHCKRIVIAPEWR